MAVTVLGFGAAEIGYENVRFDVVKRLLHSALDAGLNVSILPSATPAVKR